MDAVITWVDSTSPLWRNSYDAHKSEAPFFGLNEARFRNNGELKYLLRSIDQNMKFIENIYILTSGEVPEFINFAHGRVRLVRHQDIAPEDCLLPTFSSEVIETFMHNIEGLSNDFLYFNDDFLVLNPVDKKFFVSDDAYWINEDLPVVSNISQPGNPWENKLLNTRLKLTCFIDESITLLTAPHAPRILRRSIYADLLDLVSDEIRLLRSKRFRNDESEMHFLTFYNAMVLNYHPVKDKFNLPVKSRRLDRHNSIALHIRDSVEDFESQISLIEKFNPQFICIQDEMAGSVMQGDSRLETYYGYMNRIFPNKADFEI